MHRDLRNIDEDQLRKILDNLQTIFPYSPITLPPYDCFVEWGSLHSGEEILRESPDIEIIRNEDGEEEVDRTFPKREENAQLGEHLSIRSRTDKSFRILDVEDIILPLYSGNDADLIADVVRLIYEYATSRIRTIRSSNAEVAAESPWVALRDEAISWLSFSNYSIHDLPAISDNSDKLILIGSILKYEGIDYSLTPRQLEIINVLKHHSNPHDGLTTQEVRDQIFQPANDSKQNHSTFRIQKLFTGINSVLLGRIIVSAGAKKKRYSLARPIIRLPHS